MTQLLKAILSRKVVIRLLLPLLKAAFAIMLVLIMFYLGLTWYIRYHKQQVLTMVTATLNKNISGRVSVNNMETVLLKGFPRISLRLSGVVIKDSLYGLHRQALLQGGDITLAVNAFSLARGILQVQHMEIRDTRIFLYTDDKGYSNTSLFRTRTHKNSMKNVSFPEFNALVLRNVYLVVDDRFRKKKYAFHIHRLKGTLGGDEKRKKVNMEADVLVKSLAFNTVRGSFIEGRRVRGNFNIIYSAAEQIITFSRNRLQIGDEVFYAGARIYTETPWKDFSINIEAPSIRWKDAALMLSPNISRKLMVYDIEQPLAVVCMLKGGFKRKGDPLINVKATVAGNVLHTPGGLITRCGFTGWFTNNYIDGKGLGDLNSAIILRNFTGEYSGIPIQMRSASVVNLKRPVASGNFTTNFNMVALNNLIDDSLLHFNKGKAAVSLNFSADIINFRLARPKISGAIAITDAALLYRPRSLNLDKISAVLDFAEDNLNLKRLSLSTGKSRISIDGSIRNFLNLYYTSPEKMVCRANIYSQRLHLGELVSFIGQHAVNNYIVPLKRKGNFTEDIRLLFEKCRLDMKVKVDTLHYKKFMATRLTTNILFTGNAIFIRHAGLRHAGGSLLLGIQVRQQGRQNRYNLKAKAANVNVSRFLHAFDNFGMQSLNARNISGYLSSAASISGRISQNGALVPGSVYGKLSFSLKKGALLNFEPVRHIGRLAFPFREMDTITFSALSGRFAIKGEKVVIYPMQVNSSVLNMDVAGIYSFGKGTRIQIDVPLRNPKKDKDITDAATLARRRNRGIVLHLVAADDKDGKVKVRLGSNKKPNKPE
ncbi:hypothetical protein CHU92_11810 [Flavobacterium cyanobacteriorum]|uniref:Uncharacterized protein n=1 Tax=Flavobacterium cyanobacteriorum TaxID=2022802 RepID=A0A255YZ26_9FLAO|nr:AsmA-like C-terminal region-containing protein [Flavobacterium cyanobacteriorum]OYQ34431.1 hypothetical protein CHU92_11810 [Flavobacterium cyanobacteriorum]